MTPTALLRSIPSKSTHVLSSIGHAGEAYIQDADGQKWHVAIRTLPKYVEWKNDQGQNQDG